MAEEKDINIKILIDAADAAKSVGQTRKALKDLLVAAQGVSEGSQAFNDINKAAGQLKDRIGDLQANVKFFSDDLRGLTAANEIAQGIAASFGLVTSTFEALGLSTDSAEEATKKLIIVTTTINSLQTIGALIQKESAANIALTNIARAIGINLVVAETTATEGLTLAQRALNLVMKVSPMGILLGVTTALIGAYALLTNKTEKQEKAEKQAAEQKKQLAEAQKEYVDYMGKEGSSYLLLIEQLKVTNPLSKDRKDLIDKINSTYGTTLKNLSDETAFQNQVNKSLDEYIQFLKVKYSLQVNEEKIQKYLGKQAELEDKLIKLNKQKLLTQTNYDVLTKGLQDFNMAQAEEASGLANVKNEIADVEGKLKGVQGALKVVVSKAISDTNTINSTGLRTTAETIDKGGKKVSNANKKLEEENKKILDALIQSQIAALEKLKLITIEINSESVKPKIIDDLTDLDTKLKSIKDTPKDLIPNIIAFNDAYKIGIQENIGVLDEFGAKFDGVRKRLSAGFFGKRDEFVKSIQEIRKEFENAEPSQLNYINTITESYLKVKDIITPLQLDKMTISVDVNGLKTQLTGQEKILDQYFENIKDKLQFEGLELFKVDEKSIKETFTQIDDVTISVADKVKTLNQIQITGKEELIKLNKRLIEEEKTLLDEQSKGADTTATEAYITDVKSSIKTLEDGIKTIQTTIKTKDFNVLRELFPAKNYSEIRDNLTSIRKQIIDFNTQEFIKEYPFANTAEGISQSKKLFGEYLEEFEKGVETTTKNENAVRGYTFQIQELGKEFGKTTSDIDLFFTAIEKDITNLKLQDFDFSKLKTSYKDFIDTSNENDKTFGQNIKNFIGIFPDEVAKGNLEATLENENFLQKNTLLINEFLIKNGVSAELLAKLSTDQIKKLNKLFLKESIKTDDESLKERRAKYLDFYSSLASSITSIMNNITDNITDNNVSAIESAKDTALTAFDEETQAYEDMNSDMSNADKAKLDKDRARARERERIQKEYDDKIREAEYQGEVRKWEYAMAEAGVQAILAVLKASPNPFGMAAAGILGTLSVAAIASNPPQKLATGGMVKGPGSGTSDSVPTLLSNGESVINAKSTKMFLPMLDQINQAGGGAPLLKSSSMMAMGGVAQQTNIDTSRLENLIAQMIDRPIKTYVVSSDMTNSQNKDNRIKQRTTF